MPEESRGCGASRAASTEGADVVTLPAPVRAGVGRRFDPRQWTCRIPAVCRSLSPDTWALLGIATAILVANLPYLLGLFDPNPLDARGGLTSALTPGLLGGRPTIDPSNGFTSQALGHLAALDLLHLRPPWWNSYAATGMPLLGESQSAALFPPTLLTAFSNGQLYEHLLLELVAGCCTYRLLRRVGITRSAAIAGGVAFALNGKFAWFADASVNPVAFLPMLLLGIERAFDAARAGRRGGWRLIALAGALTVFAGFPEVGYIDTLMAVVWVGWRCSCLERGQVRAFVAKSVLGAMAGTMLAAPVLLATGTYFSHADLGIHATGLLGKRHLPFSLTPQLLMPYIYGQVNLDPHATVWIRTGGYLSTSLLLFAGLGLLSPGRRGLKYILLGWSILVFSRIYGEPPLLGHLIGVLPGMSRIQFFRYGTAALELPVVVLAALGLDYLVRGSAPRRLALGALAMIVAVFALAVYARPEVHSLGTTFEHRAFFRASVFWGAAIAAVAGGVLVLRAARMRAVLLALLVVLDVIVLFAVPEFAAPRAATVDLAPVSYLRRHLGEARFFTLGPIKPDYGSYFGLASLGVDDFPPKPYARYVRARLDPKAAFTGFRSRVPTAEQELMRHLGGYRSVDVRYVLTPPGQTLRGSSSTFRLVFRSPTARIYRLAGALPYFDAPDCLVSSPGRDRARVDCRRPGILVRRETRLAGWSAALDGHRTPIRGVGGLFQGVAVPAGSHDVSFSFSPPAMTWGLVGLLGGFALMVAPTLRRAVAGAARTRDQRPAGSLAGRDP